MQLCEASKTRELQRPCRTVLGTSPNNLYVPIVEADTDSINSGRTGFPRFRIEDDHDRVIQSTGPIRRADSRQERELDVAVCRLPDVLASPIASIVRPEAACTCYVNCVSKTPVVALEHTETEPQTAHVIPNAQDMVMPPLSKRGNVAIDTRKHQCTLAVERTQHKSAWALRPAGLRRIVKAVLELTSPATTEDRNPDVEVRAGSYRALPPRHVGDRNCAYGQGCMIASGLLPHILTS
jgi:hypothetical protein